MSKKSAPSDEKQWPFLGRNKKARLVELPSPPPWRSFTREAKISRAQNFQLGSDPEQVQRSIKLINAALLLRRPLLVTGKPGSGKSTLAHAVAYELDLGEVLVWPITTRSTLQSALYAYDAIGRLQNGQLRPTPSQAVASSDETDIGNYVRLGPLGTALLPSKRPRVLLIDEIDKSDIDLPNDLLNVFEEGEFEIPELSRLPDDAKHRNIKVRPYDGGEPAEIERGHVRCTTFPLVILTSNGEREFPPAFLRRCLRLDVKQPTPDELKRIVLARLEAAKGRPEVDTLIDYFVARRDQDKRDLATDQLLNAAHVLLSGYPMDDALRDAILRPLDDA